MIFDYYNLPFGAQLLLWTSRIALHGSCRSNPNKYQLINMAYSKVGIQNGDILLKQFISTVKNGNAFMLQPTCTRNLSGNEIDLINCIQEHKKNQINNDYYIRKWGLENNKKLFTLYSKNLAIAYKNNNLIIDLKFNTNHKDNYMNTNLISKALH